MYKESTPRESLCLYLQHVVTRQDHLRLKQWKSLDTNNIVQWALFMWIMLLERWTGVKGKELVKQETVIFEMNLNKILE